jgi:hypothetical protein
LFAGLEWWVALVVLRLHRLPELAFLPVLRLRGGRHHREVVELGIDQDGDPITSCVVVPVEEGDVAPVTRNNWP